MDSVFSNLNIYMDYSISI